jgi:hypothetical protein
MPRATGREENNQRETPSTAGTANTAAAVPARRLRGRRAVRGSG